MEDFLLIEKAIKAMEGAYSPYSRFSVGAALLCSDGEVFVGCNVENAAFSATCCAERTAFFSAVAKGKREFSKIAIVGGKEGIIKDFCPPCGVCRQVMNEFCNSDFEIILYNGKEKKLFTLKELLPLGFGGKGNADY